MTWFIQKSAELVTIYDSMGVGGDGNIRFKGTLECALTMYAFSMEECDRLRKEKAELEQRVTQLETQLKR